MQKITNKVKTMPWPSLPKKMSQKQIWHVTANLPVVDGERVLVTTFLSNPNQEKRYDWKTGKYTKAGSFRLVISKKKGDYRIVYQDGRVTMGGESIWGGNNPNWAYTRIDPEEEAKIKRYVGDCATANHYIDAAWMYAKELRDKKRKEQSVARGEIQPEDVAECPKDLPAGFERWVKSDVIGNDRTLIYKKGNRKGLCYVCGHHVTAGLQNRFTQGAIMRCPTCGTMITAILEDSKRFRADNVANVAAFQKGGKGILFIRYFRIFRCSEAEYEPMRDYIKEYARTAIRGHHVESWTKLNRYRMGWSACSAVEEEWTSHYEKEKGNYSYTTVDHVYTGNMDEELKGTSIQYSCVKEYIEAKESLPTKYAMDAARYPVMEFLFKGGYEKLVYARTTYLGKTGRTAIKWTGQSLKECFGFPTQWLKVMPPAEWTVEALERCNELYKRNDNPTQKEIYITAAWDMEPLKKFCVDIVQTASYLRKQREKEPERYRGNENAVSTYRDYLNECRVLRLDLSDEAVLHPKSLSRAHARTMSQVKYKRSPEQQKKFAEHVQKLQRYAWNKNGLLIRPALNQEELTEEGACLNHCVAGYGYRMADGRTAIFLIRKADDPDTPYYTLELTEKKIAQCRTLNNCGYEKDPDVYAFVTEWLETIIRGNKDYKPKADTTAVA